jgi:hypothetical protein
MPRHPESPARCELTAGHREPRTRHGATSVTPLDLDRLRRRVLDTAVAGVDGDRRAEAVAAGRRRRASHCSEAAPAPRSEWSTDEPVSIDTRRSISSSYVVSSAFISANWRRVRNSCRGRSSLALVESQARVIEELRVAIRIHGARSVLSWLALLGRSGARTSKSWCAGTRSPYCADAATRTRGTTASAGCCSASAC